VIGLKEVINYMSYPYRTMIVDPKADGPSGVTGWSAYVLISRMGGSYTDETVFYIPGRFETRQLALETGLKFGKMKVDEMLAG
jgi:hypothetical protein